MKRFFISPLALCCLLLCSITSRAAIYLKVETPNVSGDSTAINYTGQIEVQSFQMGVSVPVTISGGGTQVGAAQASDIAITKLLDTSSVTLLFNLHGGTHYSKMTFSFVNSSGLFYQVYMEDVVVSSFSQSSGGDRPSEGLSLNFRRVRWTYFPTPGSTTGKIEKGWNYGTNSSF